MDYRLLDNAESFSLEQAALLWCEADRITETNRMAVALIFEQLRQAAKKGDLAHDKHYVQRAREGKNWVTGEATHRPDRIDWARSRVGRTALRQWIERTGREKPLFLYPECRADWVGDSGTAWDHAGTFSLQEAAEAFAGRAAAEREVDTWLAMLIEAARRGEFPTANRRDSWNDPGDELILITPRDPGSMARVSRENIRKWAENRGMRGRDCARFLFPRHAESRAATWPVHTTPELQLLKSAAAEFWDRRTGNVPLKKEVVAWLCGQGVSANLAEAMDTIMRPPGARAGGIRPHKAA